MMLLRNYNFKGKIKHLLLFNIVTFIILIWIYDQNNVHFFGTYLEKKFNIDRTLNACYNRLLAKHGTQKNENYKRQQQNLYDHKMNKIIKEDNSNYEYLKKGLNDLDSYKKDYQRRYNQKKGLARLDCYYEKKIFDKIDYIYDLEKRMRNDKKTYKKYIYRKFAIPFIIFALLPFLGLIVPILFGGKEPKNRIVKWTTHTCKYDQEGYCKLGFIHFTKEQIKAIDSLNWIISYTLLMIVILVVIYTFIKLLKYEKLKAGKGKMCVKEYCRFCKSLFI
ncbi:hypothetical protein PVNG_03834 [Plasmodium vivax North Korean]|uniref:Variable surface protein Vir35 n=1 Tax=Plasmodium vivax North Korean TaxID=1035514 RepID=A0A0J9TSU6_PLAVI|nr:hypothetical protein PVNG_03834 [Plasmodium vivax North Korean]